MKNKPRTWTLAHSETAGCLVALWKGNQPFTIPLEVVHMEDFEAIKADRDSLREQLEQTKNDANLRLEKCLNGLRHSQTWLAECEADRDRLLEALSWYANEDTWRNVECDRLNAEGGFFPYGIEGCPISIDGGKIAREALANRSPKPLETKV